MSDPVTEDYDDEEEVDRQMTLQIIKKVFADVVSANANSAWEMGDFQCQIGKNSCSFYTTKKKISDMCNAKIRVHTGYGGAKLCDYLGVLEYYKSYPSFTIRLYPCQNKKFLLQIFFKNNRYCLLYSV